VQFGNFCGFNGTWLAIVTYGDAIPPLTHWCQLWRITGMKSQMQASAEVTRVKLKHLMSFHLKRCSRAFAAARAKAMSNTDIRPALFGAMAIISETPGIRPSAVADILGIHRANFVGIVKELEDHRIVVRAPAPDDRRAQALNLTPEGQVVYDQCLASIEQCEQELLQDFSPDEQRILIALLSRIGEKAPPYG